MIGHQLESLGSSVILLNETLLRKPITRKMRQFDYQTEQRRLTQTEGAACNQMNEFGKETLSSERSSFYRGLILSLSSSKSTFSQPFKEKYIDDVVRIDIISTFHLSNRATPEN